MVRQSKKTVVSVIKNNSTWTDFLTANAINSLHTHGLWCLGIKVTLTSLEDLEKAVQKLSNHNRHGQVPNRISFYRIS